MTYNDNIKRLREQHGMSQAEVANAIGVSKAAVCGWELGNKTLSIANLCCLADLFWSLQTKYSEGDLNEH